MPTLTKYDIALMGIRLLAIYIILQLIGSVPVWLISLSMIISQHDLPGDFKFMVICLAILAVLIPIVLWALSNYFAAFIIKSSSHNEENDKKNTNVNVKDLQAVLFCAVGIFIFITTLPDLLAWLYAFISAYAKNGMNLFGSLLFNFSKFMALFLKLIFSVILVFTANSLSNWLYKIRNAGTK